MSDKNQKPCPDCGQIHDPDDAVAGAPFNARDILAEIQSLTMTAQFAEMVSGRKNQADIQMVAMAVLVKYGQMKHPNLDQVANKMVEIINDRAKKKGLKPPFEVSEKSPARDLDLDIVEHTDPVHQLAAALASASGNGPAKA
jgi:hypothetical protein